MSGRTDLSGCFRDPQLGPRRTLEVRSCCPPAWATSQWMPSDLHATPRVKTTATAVVAERSARCTASVAVVSAVRRATATVANSAHDCAAQRSVLGTLEVNVDLDPGPTRCALGAREPELGAVGGDQRAVGAARDEDDVRASRADSP
jgi:hypothetical protein